MIYTVTEYFQKITGYDVGKYFSDVYTFITEKYPTVVSYYEGYSDIDKQVFAELDDLVTESDKVAGLIDTNYTNFSINTDYWQFVEDFEESREKLKTIKNSPKWLRSSYTNNYDKNTSVDYILSENETIESAASKLGYTDNQNDWLGLAINSDLGETGYDKEGGGLLKVTLSNNTRLNIKSVAAAMQGEDILGKDIDRDTIIEEGGDIKVLTPIETVEQSAKIKLEIRKGSLPQAGNIGLSVFEGSSVNLVRYPVLFREITNIFAQDDTFNSIEVINIRKEQDAVFMDLKIKSKLENIQLEQTISL